MATVGKSQLDRLEEARDEWWLCSLLCNLMLAVGLSIGLLMVLLLSDVLVSWPRIGLWILFLLWIGGTAGALGLVAFQVFGQRSPTEATARRIEHLSPDLGSYLINLIQLSRDPGVAQDPFRQAALSEAAEHVARVPWRTVAESRPRAERWSWRLQTWRDLLEAIVGLALVVAFALLLPLLVPRWSSSIHRMFQPWKFVPHVGRTQILEVIPGTTHVLMGTPVTFAARIAPPRAPAGSGAAGSDTSDAGLSETGGTARVPPSGRIFWINDGATEEFTNPLVASDDATLFTFTISAVTASMTYHLQVGDSESESYRIIACPKPAATTFSVRYEFPSYLGLPTQDVRQTHGDLEGPLGTLAHVSIACSVPIARATVRYNDQPVEVRIHADDPTFADFALPLMRSDAYTIHLVDTFGNTDPEPRSNAIRVTTDAAPTIQLLQPAQDVRVAAGTEIPVALRIADDHGLGHAKLEWRVPSDAKEDVSNEGDAKDRSEPEIRTWKEWDHLNGVAATTLSHPMVLDASHFSAGPNTDAPNAMPRNIEVRGVASDLRRLTIGSVVLEPQVSVTSWRRITLVSPETKAREAVARWESIHSRLWAILRTQVKARVTAAELAKAADFAAASSAVKEVRSQQIQIHTSTHELVSTLGEGDRTDEETAFRQALGKLVQGHMTRAVQQVEELGRFQLVEQLAPQSEPLLGTQDAIIESLRKLLDGTRSAAADAIKEMAERTGGDLPNDVAAKLAELSEKMQEFLKQQRKVIEATENLAKRNVEDFSEEEQQQLAQLAATEDDWSRFMAEKISDFSKLPEQDFANASLLKELVEIQTEIKMAADALTKKSADIAVPLEQLGAEMAEEMLTNIEKWLPDTPDRERWSQEEPLADDMKNAPMAELTGELEDLVGELMEDEEDLFDEMEDASSSWADSLDKGAGWDAADGPISNMSARGVTGNRLPNSSEIGGRSGEGRQGQASGEFVGDTAVGKGGRKTPSRLSPDPVVKGQVNDVSKDPVGGATGGGKESGVGGEGLEGPVRQQMQRDMQRLANRQADLRNRAEGVDLKFQVLNYNRTDLQRLIEAMKSVEADLRSGRYQNALRHREVLVDNLGNLKTYVDGEFQVRSDDSINLPEDVQKELLGSMLDASPTGWETLNRKYFERLSQSKPATDPATSDTPARNPPAAQSKTPATGGGKDPTKQGAADGS